VNVPDFTSPIPRTSVNGFPIRFRKDCLSENLTLWVPQRITRNQQSKGWRIIINHADGQVRLWEGDKGRSPIESLQSAWRILVNELQSLKTPITQLHRKRIPGRKRDSFVDTGVDGVMICRRRGKYGRSKSVSVRMIQRLTAQDKASRPATIETFSVAQNQFLKSPEFYQEKFEKGLCLAAAIRARYLELYSIYGPLQSPVKGCDISSGEIPEEPVIQLKLEDIFSSYE
jgi:hypothetical protein